METSPVEQYWPLEPAQFICCFLQEFFLNCQDLPALLEGLAPWVCYLGSHTGSHTLKSLTDGLIFCYYCLEIINNFNNFHFLLGPSDLCAWSCFLSSCPFQPCVMFFSLEGTCNSGGWGWVDLTHFCLQDPAQRKVPQRPLSLFW